MNSQSQNGFTLYEILITLLIVGVVMTLGLPNLTAFTQNSRVTTTANDLHGSFYLARSEAARGKNNITMLCYPSWMQRMVPIWVMYS